MCDVNLITAAFALENYALVDEVWAELEPRLESLRPYAGSALASYGATLIGRGRYQQAIEVLTHPVQHPRANQPVDDIAILCCAFCRANLASAHINLGNFEAAAEQLNGLSDSTGVHPVLATLSTYLRALLTYFQGRPDECRAMVGGLDITRLPLLYQTELYYHFAIALARCGDVENAGRAVSRVQWETSSHRKLTRLRILAQAEIAAAEQQDEKALSYYRDLLALGHIDALVFLRAANLARKTTSHSETVRTFLEGAVRLDPESHWAEVARGRLAQ